MECERKCCWYTVVVYPICRSVCVSVCQLVGLSVQKMYCDKTADWIWMPFRVVSGVSWGMDILDGIHVPQGKGVLVFFNHIGLNGIFLTEMYLTRA